MKAPITQLQSQITTEKADISAWGQISGAMSSLSTALSNIKNVGSISSYQVSTTNSATATATVGNSATTGTYRLTNVTLATSQEIYSNLVGSAAATLSGGGGSLVVTTQSGKNETIAIGSGSLSLNGVAAAVNKAADGVTASVIGTSAGARLVLSSSGTGASAAFTVSGTGALAQFDYNPTTSGGSETLAQAAGNAAVTLNGIPITSTTNVLGSAVAGLTISLAGTGSSVISVSSAPTNLSSSVEAVATSLNAAISTITKETKYVPATTSSSGSGSSSAKAGPLLGNFSATSLKDELMSSVSALVASGVSAGAAGLSINSSGSISFNATSFANEYAQNPAAVKNLVTALYTKLDGITVGAIGAGSSSSATGTKETGFIGTATTSLNAVVTSIDSQITELQKQNSAALNILINQYTVAENKASSASIAESYLSIFTSTSSSSS
jgi:flagellar hook-associated protein 2